MASTARMPNRINAELRTASPTDEPAELLQNLVRQAQLLACLQWLGSFQILALIPQDGSVAYDVLADLTGLPATRFRRVIGMTSCAGVLREPEPGSVAHTPLSSAFVLRPSLLDGLMFIAETLVPASLSMPKATPRDKQSHQQGSAYQIATNSSLSIGAACDADARLRRQLNAFRRLTVPAEGERITQSLVPLDWKGLGSSTVVEVNARSMSTVNWLASRNSNLQFIVQTMDYEESLRPKPRVRNLASKHQFRTPGTPQIETMAAVYLLHLPDPLLSSTFSAYIALCTDELRIHFEVLGTNKNATLVFIADILPNPSASSFNQDQDAYLRDLLLLQSGHEDPFDLKSVQELVASVRISTPHLSIRDQNVSVSPSTAVLVFRSA